MSLFYRSKNETEADAYQSLTDEEIQTFITEKSIEPISIEEIYGFYTIVIFSNDSSRGYYEVYKKNNEVRKGRRVIAFGSVGENTSIRFNGGTASGQYPFVVFHVTNEEYLKNGYSIEIFGDSGNSIKFKLTKLAYAVETKQIGIIKKYCIYNSEGVKLLDEFI